MKGKPAPDIFIITAATFLGRNVGQPDETPDDEQLKERSKGLVFEDSLPGVQAGKRAGMSGTFSGRLFPILKLSILCYSDMGPRSKPFKFGH